MEEFEVKTDCFAYNKELNRCNALDSLFCKREKCNFYKTKKERCQGCKEAKGHMLTCVECVRNGIC